MNHSKASTKQKEVKPDSNENQYLHTNLYSIENKNMNKDEERKTSEGMNWVQSRFSTTSRNADKIKICSAHVNKILKSSQNANDP